MGKPFEKFKGERIEDLQESIRFFSNQNRRQRDLWVAQHFLSGHTSIEETALAYIPDGDPPDVVYRDINFEVKEILDTGRRRHDEYKQLLANAQKAKRYSDFLQIGKSIKKISVARVYELLEAQLAHLRAKYALAVRATADLLFYVDLSHSHLIVDGETIGIRNDWKQYGFRSISFVFHKTSCVLYAAEGAPMLIRDNLGKVVNRMNYF